jgi:tetratricopeptide (TPR) repeat protein
MKKRLTKNVLLAALMIAGIGAFAQCKTPEWPADKAKAEESLAIYGDAVKAGNYNEAKSPLMWLIKNAPKVNRQIYIDGADMYDKFATAEKDPAKKQVLIDSMLIMYDLRMASCGEEAAVLNRKVNASFKHNYKNKEKLPLLLQDFDKVFEMNGNNVSDPTLTTYMNLTSLNSKYVKNLNCEQVLQRYDKLVVIIDAKIKVAMEKNKPADVEKLKGYKTQIDDLMITTVTDLKCVNCDFVKKNMEPKFREKKDLDMAKKMFVFMTADKCTDDPLWLELADFKIDNNDRDFAIVKNAAIKHISNGKMDRGEELIKIAETLAKEPKEKGDIYEIQAGLAVKNGNKVAARDLYFKANSADPTNLEALSKIASLYMNSFDECKKLKSKAEDRLIYLAAFDMYARAKDNAGMGRAKAQFPGKEEIFELNWKAGDVKTIDCWVGGSVVIRTRD